MADGLPIFLQENYCLHYHSVHHKTDMNYPGLTGTSGGKYLAINLLPYSGKIS